MNDREIAELISNETNRQRNGLELIPSENYVSKDILAAVGSILTNKYSEGYPHKRYYGGNQVIDQVEELAIARGKALFQTDYHLNVQPYSGSPANLAAYVAVLEFGDKIMGMRLDMGGHLTHGHPVNFSGRAYQFIQYGVDQASELIDYDDLAKMAKKERPKMIVCGATAYSRQIDFKRFAEIAQSVGAILMADISHIAGLIAAGEHPSPFGLADIITTTTHKTLRGPRSAVIFCRPDNAKAIDKAVFPGMQGGPHDHVTAAKAICFKEAATAEFKNYTREIIANSRSLAEALAKRGYRVVAGGTDNHLILLDLRGKGLSGTEAESVLDRVGITVNKNTIPYDPNPPLSPSGIRLGTAAITSRRMTTTDMVKIAELIDRAITDRQNDQLITKLAKEVSDFASPFYLPGIDEE